METTSEQFEQSWRTGVCGAFLCSREAVLDMLSAERARSSLPAQLLRCGGAAARWHSAAPNSQYAGLAQSLAVELWPKGIHVTHIIIDGVIDTPQVRNRYRPAAKEPLLKLQAIADAYWNLIRQDHSAWSLEIDLRPNKEGFFE